MLRALWIVTLPLIISSSGQVSFAQPAVPSEVTMYWTDNGTNAIHRANIYHELVEDLVTTGLIIPIAVTLDLEGGKLYWADSQARSVGRANLDGSSAQNIVSTSSRGTHPYGVAVDPEAGKVYWTEWCDEACTFSSIRRANLDGTSGEILIDTNNIAPAGIAIDIAAGKIYWVGPNLNRANTNGSNVQMVVHGSVFEARVGDIELDVDAGHIYWAETPGSIKRANMSDGSNLQTIVTDPPTNGGLGLDLLARKVYWTTQFGGEGIYRANMDGTNVELVRDSPIDPIGLALDTKPLRVVPTVSTLGLAISIGLLLAAGAWILFFRRNISVRRRDLFVPS